MAADLFKALEGGTAATHPEIEHLLLVGPATGPERNTFKPEIIPIACWRVEDMRFEFDSSFVRPEMRPELQELAGLVEHVRQSRPGTPPAPLSVFGHADPAGKDDYNKQLSGRRAAAIYAMLIRDADTWEDLYSHPHGGDDWGVRAIQTMLATAGYSPGPVDGVLGSGTTGAIKAFQKDKGLPAGGTLNRETRRQVFLAYMDAICTRSDGSPFRLQRTDFLANGADPGGKGDYQGCSEFNPVLVFSKAEQQEYSKPGNKTKRDQENAPNRRVVVFIFRPGIRVTAGRWPCPRAKDGVGPCKKRFWSDGEERRKNQAQRREFKDTKDTFACRFYQRLSTQSPCEGVLPVVVPWTAAWDRPLVRHGDKARMLLKAPGLAAGDPVIFEVTQEGYGPIGQVQAAAGAGQAEADWRDWYHPDRVTYEVALKPGEPFPPVKYTFIATAGGRGTPAAAPLVYEDFLRLQASYRIDQQTSVLAKNRTYTVYSPWGTRKGKTKKHQGEDGWVIEDGLPPGGASVVLGQRSLL